MQFVLVFLLICGTLWKVYLTVKKQISMRRKINKKSSRYSVVKTTLIIDPCFVIVLNRKKENSCYVSELRRNEIKYGWGKKK